MANSFNLRRGGLSMCPGDTCSEELQMRAAPRAHRLALLYARAKQASKLQKQMWQLAIGYYFLAHSGLVTRTGEMFTRIKCSPKLLLQHSPLLL